MDFARRAHDHNYRIDPIVRSLLDSDFYKFLMGQIIWELYPNDKVTLAVTNRTKAIRIADMIDVDELRAQLDHVRTLRFTQSELIWMTGQTFYGKEGIFKKGYIDTLRTLTLPKYYLSREMGDEGASGQYVLEFTGTWFEVTMWEIYALEIINELRYRAIMKTMSKSELDIMYARAKVKLYSKLEALRELDGLNLTDFGTRRRHSFLWQEHCVLTASEVLGENFTGTSNAYLAMKHGIEAKGTNAHELPMVLAALAPDDESLKASQYKVLQHWQNTYHAALRVFLPDTFGTTQFLRDAPQWVANWIGARPDSKNPIAGGEELIEYWNRFSGSAKDKIIIFSDGMDVAIPGNSLNGEDIATVHNHFKDRVRVGFGFGTNLTNDFRGTHPTDPDVMKPISLVCKVKSANGHGAVKLSDSYSKATGTPADIERYRRVFGTDGIDDLPVLV
jgi:nicotinate phosphoribosyltransferase